MTKVIIDVSMSLDGFIAGPDGDGIEHVFGWYSALGEDGNANKQEIDRMHADSGACITGRRTYDLAGG